MAQTLFLHTPGISEKEKQMIIKLKHEELGMNLVSDIKIVSSGTQQLQKAINQEKKREKKQRKEAEKNLIETDVIIKTKKGNGKRK